jgi:GNAT superfamily N-acetyltransferase
VIVRPARPDEADALAQLAAVTLRAAFARDIPAIHLEPYLASSFTPANAAAELSDPHVRLLVAEDAGEVGGYAKLQLGPAPVPAARPIELVRMYLLPAWYGRGAGNELMTRSLGEAHALACDVLWLKVWARTGPTRSTTECYSRMGNGRRSGSSSHSKRRCRASPRPVASASSSNDRSR